MLQKDGQDERVQRTCFRMTFAAVVLADLAPTAARSAKRASLVASICGTKDYVRVKTRHDVLFDAGAVRIMMQPSSATRKRGRPSLGRGQLVGGHEGWRERSPRLPPRDTKHF